MPSNIQVRTTLVSHSPRLDTSLAKVSESILRESIVYMDLMIIFTVIIL